MSGMTQKPNRSEFLRRAFEDNPSMTLPEASALWKKKGEDPSLDIGQSLYNQVKKQEGTLWFPYKGKTRAETPTSSYERPSQPIMAPPTPSNGIPTSVNVLVESEPNYGPSEEEAQLQAYESLEAALDALLAQASELRDNDVLRAITHARRLASKAIVDMGS